MRVSLYGAQSELAQLTRIRDAFELVYWEISHNNPDLIYCNDLAHVDKAIANKLEYPNAVLILNVLDIPIHCWKTFDYIKAQTSLQKADIVSTISHSVREDIYYHFGLDSQVIYNPIQDIQYVDCKKEFQFLYVGRANDPNKRFDLVKKIVLETGYGHNNLNVVGTENPQFGNYLGVIPVDELSQLYSKTKFLLLPSNMEGLGLTAIEASICGCIPILNKNNSCSLEFFPEFTCYPDNISQFVDELNQNYSYNRHYMINKYERYKTQFSKFSIAKNIIKK